MTDTNPPFPKRRGYYLILKIAVLLAAVAFALAYFLRSA